MIKKPSDCVACIDCRFWVDEDRQYMGHDMGQCRAGLPELGPGGNGYWPRLSGIDFCYIGELRPIFPPLTEEFEVTESDDEVIVEESDDEASWAYPFTTDQPPVRIVSEDFSFINPIQEMGGVDVRKEDIE